MLCKENEAILRYFPINNNGDIDIDKFSEEISNKTNWFQLLICQMFWGPFCL